MQAITRDCDSGVVDQDCRPLDEQKVINELLFCLKSGDSFLGKPASHWLADLMTQVQAFADEADPDEYEFWNIKYLEKQ